MSEFFARPWWGRIWVCQDLAVASAPKFQCGDIMLELDIIENFMKFFTENIYKLYAVTRAYGEIYFSAVGAIYHNIMKVDNLLLIRSYVQEYRSRGKP